MYTGLLLLHNLLRYVVVILLILAIVQSFAGWFQKNSYDKKHNKTSLFLLITCHLQLIIGLTLYFIGGHSNALSKMAESMSNATTRFWAVEHIFSMIIAIVLITLGRIMAKKAKTDLIKFRRQSIYFLLAFILIFNAIPWPWSAVARAWF